MIKDKNIDKIFREKLKDYEQQPPAYLLENILAGAAGARRKRKIVFWRMAGVAAALLLAFVAGWQVNYLNRESVKQPMVASRNSAPQTKEKMNAVAQNDTAPGKVKESKSTTNNRDTRFATADASKAETSSGNGKNAQPASIITQHDQNTLAETRDITTEPDLLDSLKTNTPLINPNDQIGVALQEKKVDNSIIEPPERSLDQQIIEQNQAQLQAVNKKRKDSHWLVGAQVSPAYSVNRSSHSALYASNMLNSSSNTPVALGGGLTVEYKKGKRWSLQSGIYYAGLGQSTGDSPNYNRDQLVSTNKGSEYFNAPVDIKADKMMVNSTAGIIEFNGTSNGVVLGTNLEDKSLAKAVVVSDARFTQNFQYLEIPLYLRYTVLDARFDVELMGGFSSNVLIGNDTYLQNSTGKSLVGKTQDMQSLNYSGTVGFGLKYGVSRRIFLNLEPRIKYYLNSLNSNSEVTYKPYTIGVYTGISYQF